MKHWEFIVQSVYFMLAEVTFVFITTKKPSFKNEKTILLISKTIAVWKKEEAQTNWNFNQSIPVSIKKTSNEIHFLSPKHGFHKLKANY